jgi:hypothetical protein
MQFKLRSDWPRASLRRLPIFVFGFVLFFFCLLPASTTTTSTTTTSTTTTTAHFVFAICHAFCYSFSDSKLEADRCSASLACVEMITDASRVETDLNSTLFSPVDAHQLPSRRWAGFRRAPIEQVASRSHRVKPSGQLGGSRYVCVRIPCILRRTSFKANVGEVIEVRDHVECIDAFSVTIF